MGGQRGLDPGRPSQAAAQGLALAVQEIKIWESSKVKIRESGQIWIWESSKVKVCKLTKVKVRVSLKPLKPIISSSAQAMCCYCLYRVDSSAPISSVNSY